MELYYHKTDGGAEYYSTKYIECKSGHKEGAAQELGRCEGGETVTITTKGGRELSRVIWTPENGGRYIRVNI